MKDFNPRFRYFIDTNIFLRIIVKEEDKTYQDSRAFLNQVKNGKIKAFSSAIVLAEIAWTLKGQYRRKKSFIVNALRAILNIRGLKFVDDYNPSFALEIFGLKKIKFIDALIASLPLIADPKTKLVSYDKEFDRLKLKRIEP